VKRFALIFLVLYAAPCYATWSGLAHVTPETQEKFKIRVCIAEVPTDNLSVEVYVWTRRADATGWVITTKEYVQPSRQSFRRYIWNDQIDDSPIESIESIEYDEVPIPIRVYLNRSLLSRSYVYFDWPTPIFDGGYYYSIDLSTFADRVQHKC
jgi:hypothetical protein